MTTPVVLTSVQTDRAKSDLNADPKPPMRFIEKLAIVDVQFNARFVLESAMTKELFALAQGLGLDMFNRFKSNPTAGQTIPFTSTTQLGQAVLSGSDIKQVHKNVMKELDVLLQAQFQTGRVNINSLQATVKGKMQGNRDTLTNPNGIKTSPVVDINLLAAPLQAVIGRAFGGGTITVAAFDADQVTYGVTLKYELIDHFGVDNSDVLPPLPHGSAGQKSFWVLQHRHTPGFMPFVTQVFFSFRESNKWVPRK